MQPQKEGVSIPLGGKDENMYLALDNHQYLISSLDLHADVKI